MSVTHILIVIPEPERRQALVGALTARGHSVFGAADAEETLRLAALHLPQVILIDMGLTDISAYDLFRILRTTPPYHQSWMVAIGAHTPDPARYDLAGINASINLDGPTNQIVDQLILLPGSPLGG